MKLLTKILILLNVLVDLRLHQVSEDPRIAHANIYGDEDMAKLQILPSTDVRRFVGSSRLVMTFSPVPPKNPSRQDSVVTL